MVDEPGNTLRATSFVYGPCCCRMETLQWSAAATATASLLVSLNLVHHAVLLATWSFRILMATVMRSLAAMARLPESQASLACLSISCRTAFLNALTSDGSRSRRSVSGSPLWTRATSSLRSTLAPSLADVWISNVLPESGYLLLK